MENFDSLMISTPNNSRVLKSSEVPPHTPSSVSKESCNRSPSQNMQYTSDINNSLESKIGFTVSGSDKSFMDKNITNSNVQAPNMNNIWNSNREIPTTTAISSSSSSTGEKKTNNNNFTLNPDAKEFQLPFHKTADMFTSSIPISTTPQNMIQMPFMYTGPNLSQVQLFAVPSLSISCQPSPAITSENIFPTTIKTEVMKWPTISANSRSVFSRDMNSAANTIAAVAVNNNNNNNNNNVITPRTLTRNLAEEYVEECKKMNYHMVAVFNLEQRTTNEELLSIFFPLCAIKAEMLPLHRSPRPNRGAGVVFFRSKDFAMVAVEKLNDFVPKGQHQPLTVQYCGPDVILSSSDFQTREISIPSTASQNNSISPTSRYSQNSLIQTFTSIPTVRPWRLTDKIQLDRIHEEMWRFVCGNRLFTHGVMKYIIAVHGIDPDVSQEVLTCNFIKRGAERFDIWPIKISGLTSTSTSMLCNSVSAIVWYSQEVLAREAVTWFQQRIPEGQNQFIEVFYLNNINLSSTNSRPATGSSQVYSEIYENNNNVKSIGGTATPISNSSINATNISKTEIFDKIDAFFLRDYADPKVHLVGVHNLSSKTDKRTLYRLFAPHDAFGVEMYPTPVIINGEIRSSGVAFFNTEDAARSAAEKLDKYISLEQPNPVIARYLIKYNNSETMKFLKSGNKVISSEVLDNMVGISKLNLLILSVEEELKNSLVDAGKLTEKMLQIIMDPETTDEVVKQLADVIERTLTVMEHHSVTLSTPLVDALLSLHEKLNIPKKHNRDNNTEEQAQDPIIAKNTLYMQMIARSLINLFMNNSKPHESRKVAAVLSGYLFQFSYMVRSPYELAVRVMEKNEKSIRLAHEYRRNGSSLNINSNILLDNEDQKHEPWLTLMECLEQVISIWRQNNKSRAKKDPHRKEYEKLILELCQIDSFNNKGGIPSLTTSARPTPRRVIAKVTPGTGSSSPGLTQASPVIPHVNLRTPGGEGNGVSNDISIESIMSCQGFPSVLCMNEFNNNNNNNNNNNVVVAAASSSLGVSSWPDKKLHMLGAPQQQQKEQQQLQQMQMQRSSMVRPYISDLNNNNNNSNVLESIKLPLGIRLNVPLQSVYTHAELMERTVYITKLPSNLRRAQFRRLLSHFGEFNKVRLCRDDNQFQSKTTDISNITSYNSADTPVSLWFSFVEFAEHSSAKTMIEYFRNATSMQQPFGFLLDNSSNSLSWPESSHFTIQNIQALLNARTSPARNPIHDQTPIDAILSCVTQQENQNIFKRVIRNRVCLFGLEDGDKTIDSVFDFTSFQSFSPSLISNISNNFRNSNVTMTGNGVGLSSTNESLQYFPTTTTTTTTNSSSVVLTHRDTTNISESTEDEVDFNAIFNTVVEPSVSTSNTALLSENNNNNNNNETFQQQQQNGDHIFNPLQVPWLMGITQSTQQECDLWGTTMIHEDNFNNNNNNNNNNNMEEMEKEVWPSYMPPFGNPLIDDEEDDD